MKKLLINLLFLYALTASASIDPDDLLDVDVAFKPSVSIEGDQILIDFEIADEYYLYRHAFKFSAKDLTLTDAQIPAGKKKTDEFFGDVEIYRKHMQIIIPFSNPGVNPVLTYHYQGCADLGICYPPQRKIIALDIDTPSQAFKSFSNPLGNTLSQGGNFFGGQQSLSVEEAFQYEAIAMDSNSLNVRFTMAENIYLYKDSVILTSLTDGITVSQINFPDSVIKDDPEFGLVDVFYGLVEVDVSIKRNNKDVDSLSLQAEYQGCEDEKICYPPVSQVVKIDLPEYVASINAQIPAPSELVVADDDLSEQEIITQTFDGSLLWIIVKFLGFGLLLSLTPCVFPMIPILSSLIVGQGKISTAKAFSLSLVYVLAMALTYTIVGVIAGKLGVNLQAMFQEPWIIISFSIVFVLLALSMFGFYELQLPASWQRKISGISNKQKSGSIMGVAIMGFLSALIVGPCVAPPLAAAVIYISSENGGALLGGIALFSMSMGMGMPLLAVGTTAGKWMPQSGGWMNVVKSFFGILLLGMGIWFLSRILGDELILMLWGVLAIASAVMWHQNAIDNGVSGWVKSLFDTIKILLLAIGLAQLLGSMAGNSDPFKPLKGVFSGGVAIKESKVEFDRIKSLADLNQVLKNTTKPVFLDFYADWCTECIRMENTTFKDPRIVKILEQFTVIKADVTENDELDIELTGYFNIVGPPASLFFDEKGMPLKKYNFFGFKSADELIQTFESILN